MAKVDIAELEKKVVQKKAESSDIESRKIGDNTVFRGRVLDQWFDNYDECVNANQDAKRIAEYKALGLNEHGQTPEDVERAKRRKVLVDRKEALLKQVADLDKEISALKNAPLEVKVEEPKKKK